MKGWSAAWITGNVWVYAFGTVFASLAAGPLIDAGVSIEAICGIFALSCIAATALQVLGQITNRWDRPAAQLFEPAVTLGDSPD